MKVIGYFSDRDGQGGVSVVMEKLSMVGGISKHKSPNGTLDISHNRFDRLRAVSSLLIRSASPAIDEGRYTCSPSDGTTEASTMLHVIEGKRFSKEY